MIELYLSSDGKHTVHAAADTPEQLHRLVPSASQLYEQVLGSYGTKAQMWQEATNARSNGGAKTTPPNGAPAGAKEDNVPRCPVHGRPMVYRRGRYGAFWSCPTRMPNGVWCTVTREVDDGQSNPKLS